MSKSQDNQSGRKQIRKYIATDMKQNNAHLFLSDDCWTTQEHRATLFDDEAYAIMRAKDCNAKQPHVVRVEILF